MDKIFTVDGYGKYHVPEINFDQLDALVEHFPKLMAIVQSEKFDFTNKAHLNFAFIQGLNGAPFNTLISILICPAERNYWQKSDMEHNTKLAGRLPVSKFIARDESGNFVPGEIAESFFDSNPLFRALFDTWISSLNTGKEQAATTDGLTVSEAE